MFTKSIFSIINSSLCRFCLELVEEDVSPVVNSEKKNNFRCL